MADTTSDLIPQIDQIRANPIAIQRLMLRRLDEVTNGGVRIVDPTNPFVFLMESACAVSAAAMLRNETLNRRQYPSVAITDEDLYLHMSDKDYLNRFHSPSSATFTIILNLEELKQAAVPVTGTSGVKKLTIPRHTEISVADTAFTMQYPIEIRVMPHGGLIVTYDVQKPSPLYLRESNAVDWFIVSVSGERYLRMDIPVTQFKITTFNAQMNAITGYSKSFSFTDNFYYCRAFIKANNGQWDEIRTTHTDQVYDPNYPTAVLKVLNQRLAVQIPQIYFTNQTIRDALRIDVYTTKGPLDIALANYTMDAFSATWTDLDEEDAGLYSAPLNTFAGVSLFSTDYVRGGAVPLTFDELRERVITRSLSRATLPITNAQLETTLEDIGYQLVVNVDNITNRQFLATRSLPAPTNQSTYTGAGVTIKALQSTLTALAALDTVSDNITRVTIKPDTLYRNTNGVLSIVPNNMVEEWLTTYTPDQLAATINANSFLYSPFYYVFDVNNDEFDVRPYRLDNPTVVSKFFVSENETAQFEASVIGYDVLQTEVGYSVFAELRASESVKAESVDNLKLQLSYIPPGSSVRVHVEGALAVTIDPETGRPLGDRYIYRFLLNTDYDITEDHHLALTDSSTPMLLTTTFDVAVILLNNLATGANVSDIDAIVDSSPYTLATSVLGVSHERVTLRLGNYLENLWVRSRSFVDDLEFDCYLTDQLATYGNTVYLRDENGNIELTYNGITLEYEYTVLHWAGEPILNVTGTAAFDAWLLLNPESTSNLFDWISTLTTADRLLYITNLADIRISPNSTDTPLLTVDGQNAYDAWLILNPTSDSDVFDWWATLNDTQRHDYSELAHLAGDIILNEFGNPTVAGGGARAILRQADLLLLDGKYYFATEAATLDYRNELVETMTQWVVEDIAGVAKDLIEQTSIYFYPKNTIGQIPVFIGEAQRAIVLAEQSLVVRYQVSREVYENPSLRESIETATIEALASALDASKISHSGLINRLQNAIGSDVESIDLTGFMDNQHRVVTMVDNSKRPSLGKTLTVLSNKTLGIRDAVTVEFINNGSDI